MTTRQSEEIGVSHAKKTILVVEDDEAIAELVVAVLREETPHIPLLATNGYEALRLVYQQIPDLFLLNYHLPRMTGLELSERIRSLPGLEHASIIIMSANLPIEELKKRHLFGIKKPFELDKLLGLIEQALTSSEDGLQV